MKNQYALRPYHNPQNADESLVPKGWRMLYADEFPMPVIHGIPCRLFIKPMWFVDSDPSDPDMIPRFGDRTNCVGRISGITYIIPVNP